MSKDDVLGEKGREDKGEITRYGRKVKGEQVKCSQEKNLKS